MENNMKMKLIAEKLAALSTASDIASRVGVYADDLDLRKAVGDKILKSIDNLISEMDLVGIAADEQPAKKKRTSRKSAEAPVAEAPVAEAPVAEAPVAEAPVAEAPAAEAPVAETPVAEVQQAVKEVEEIPVEDVSPTQTRYPASEEEKKQMLEGIRPQVTWLATHHRMKLTDLLADFAIKTVSEVSLEETPTLIKEIQALYKLLKGN